MQFLLSKTYPTRTSYTIPAYNFQVTGSIIHNKYMTDINGIKYTYTTSFYFNDHSLIYNFIDKEEENEKMRISWVR